ncbi:MAG: alanine--tRNA ligase [Candidatus Nanoarchaeia archaeon]|nr:alanine--tRNA ligase [Candidatus Nanoarchaeia archaeon]
MKANELRKKWMEFFKSKNHSIIKSSSLIPENDPTVLFTTAGMHPLVPFLLGEKHPLGKKLANVQKCIRTGDIEEVGDNTHLTFFEMLGNWSLGDYFKKEAIEFSFEFLTSKKWLNIPIERLGVTCFIGNKDASKDEEAANIWLQLGISKERIAFLPEEDNWWGPAGITGPCGPCSEMFYWISNEPVPKKFDPKNKNWVEIWNDVFMQYNKTKEGKFEPLKQKNVDTGMGVERTITALQGKKSVYETELFIPIIKEIKSLIKEENEKYIRIIADHLKASTFIIADGGIPSNVERGYVLRRLIRRAVRFGRLLGIKENFCSKIAVVVIDMYKDEYPELINNKKKIVEELNNEENRFLETLEKGLKLIENLFKEKIPIDKEKFSILINNPNKSLLIGRIFELKRNKKDYSLKEPKLSEKEIDLATIKGNESFILYQSYGFPLEMIDELAMAKGFLVDHHSFIEELKKHQELSRTATEGMFKSGLADNSNETTKLHTATHMLNEALRIVLKKEDIHQKGSNITPERLRFDFNFDRKLTEEELKKIENLVNEKIKENLEVKKEEMSPDEAKKRGAKGVFEHKYGEKVSVYSIGNFSKEICAGPHVKNTKELGKFKILKEESVSAGVRRIKAVLE